MNVLMRPGDLVKIPEAHYRYGVGDLVLRIREVGQVQRVVDEDWQVLTGMQIGWNGVEMGKRRVLVRLSGLLR